MADDPLVRASKALSMLLRHDPGRFDVVLDEEGWADVSAVVAGLVSAGFRVDMAVVTEIVEEDEKRRYALSSNGTRIRANQGHSVAVDLGLAPGTPPAELYHGTVKRFLDAIRRDGLVPGSRSHVHLSATRETAEGVGRRRGRPVVLVVDAARMHADGHGFFLSENGVWLAEHVPAMYLRFPVGRGDGTRCAP